MGREEVRREMRELLGTELAAFDRVPDEFIDSEWDLVKRLQFGDTTIPGKYKALIGLAVAAAIRCHHGVVVHSETAGWVGASDAEMAEALQYAKLVTGWGLYSTGLDVDNGELAAEAKAIALHATGGNAWGVPAVTAPA